MIHDHLISVFLYPTTKVEGFTKLLIKKVTEDKVWLKFKGEGRWRFRNTLDAFFSNDESRSLIDPYRDDLIKRLYKDKEEIIIEYQDYEPGCEILNEKN